MVNSFRAIMNAKGQVTIPAQVRAALGLSAGVRIEFVELENRQFALIAANHSVRELKGLLRRRGRPVSIKEMNARIAARGSSSR